MMDNPAAISLIAEPQPQGTATGRFQMGCEFPATAAGNLWWLAGFVETNKLLAPDADSEILLTLFRDPITGVVMAINRKLLNREILLGFWKVHILHHAAEGPLVGQWMLHELREHGYHVSPGTLYPLLRRMEKTGWLRCRVDKKAGPKARREYFLTLAGREALKEVLVYLQELRGEVAEARKKSP